MIRNVRDPHETERNGTSQKTFTFFHDCRGKNEKSNLQNDLPWFFLMNL